LNSVSIELGYASPTALRQDLRSPWALGIRTSNKGQIRLETNLVNDQLVSQATFDHVQELLAVRLSKWTQRKNLVGGFLGVGVLHCQCGAKMYAKTDPRPGYAQYYVCGDHHRGVKVCPYPWYRIDRTDAEILWSVLEVFTNKNSFHPR
jgi:hypothetical protein